MLVSALKQTSPGRITVIFEDGREIRSSLGVVTDLRLFTGKDLEEEQITELRQLSLRSLARDRALEYLSRRPMSCKELHDKLLQKGEEEAVADFCVSWLMEQGFLNDERYAGMVVRHYAAKNYGVGRIRGELSRRGIPRELWDAVLQEAPEPDDKLDKFIASRLRDPEDRDQIQKISNALYRRGYGWDQIRDALRRYTDTVYEE